MSGSDAKKLSRRSKAELVETIMQMEGRMEDEADSPAPLYEIRSKVNYTQFFPRPEGKPDVMVSSFGTTPLPEDMLHDKHLHRAIEDGKLTEPYKVESYSLPPKDLEVPDSLTLIDPRDKEAVKNILSGNDYGRRLVTMEAPRTRAKRPDIRFMQDRLLPILLNARWVDQQTHEMPEDLRELLNGRIKEIEGLA